MTSSQTTDTSPSFRLKGGLYPLTQLEINHYCSERFQRDLEAKVAEAPAFFRQTPVVLNFEQFDGELDGLPLKELKQLCLDVGLLPIAVRGNDRSLSARALVAGMPTLSGGRVKEARSPDPAESDAADDQPDRAGEAQTADGEPGLGNRLITNPVRSGQQVYAQGDLVVVAPVSAGAEILADGNIHVYGPLRGRALAGVKGDRDARIFCHSLEAELVSIAGDFKLDEDLRGTLWKQAVHIRLNDQSLDISAL